jgi:hypothetical protein
MGSGAEMKTWFQWMTSPVLAVCLFLAALVSTTAAFADMPAISAYDADTTYVISGNALTESQSTIQPVLLFGQIAGLVAAETAVAKLTQSEASALSKIDNILNKANTVPGVIRGQARKWAQAALTQKPEFAEAERKLLRRLSAMQRVKGDNHASSKSRF